MDRLFFDHLPKGKFISITKHQTGYKTKQERKKKGYLFKAAQMLTPVHRANFLKCREEIEKRRRDIQEKRSREKQRKNEKEIREKEELTRKIAHMRLWMTNEDIEDSLKNMVTRKECIKTTN